MEKEKMIDLLPDEFSAEDAEHVMKITEEIIRVRKKKDNAPNGTPMDTLDGAAKTVAELANIGTNIVGEGGIQQGINTLLLHAKASGIVEGMQSSKS